MGEPLAEPVEERTPADAAGNQPLLAFVHIPRTGGGTVSSAISKNYDRLKSVGNIQKGPEKTRSGLENVAAKPGQWQAVGDHVPLGLFRRYLPADTRYMTILRDPVDRVLSHYHFHAQAGDPPGSRGAVKLRGLWEQLLNNERTELGGPDETISLGGDTEFSLEEGLKRRICIYDNFMTRFLWGGDSIYGELPPDALERAKDNIADFWFVGFRERLDESIVLLGRKLGIGLMPYYLRHVSTKRPPIEETSRELRALVAEHNALDIELYRFARELFEESAPPPDELTDEVAELGGGASRSRKRALPKERHGRSRASKSDGTGKPPVSPGDTQGRPRRRSLRCPRPRSDAGGSPGQRGSRGGVSTGTRKTPGPARRRTSKTKRRVSQTLLSDFSSAA